MEGKAGRGLGLIPLLERVSVSPVVVISSAENDNHRDVTDRVYTHMMNHRLHEPPADDQVTTRSSCSHTQTLAEVRTETVACFFPPDTNYGWELWCSEGLVPSKASVRTWLDVVGHGWMWLPLHRTPGGCSSSSRRRQPPRLRTRRRGRRARSTSCGCRSEEGHTWGDTGQAGQTQEVVTVGIWSRGTEMAQVLL